MKKCMLACAMFAVVSLSCMTAEARLLRRAGRVAVRAAAVPVRVVRTVQPVRRNARGVRRVRPLRVVRLPVRAVRVVGRAVACGC